MRTRLAILFLAPVVALLAVDAGLSWAVASDIAAVVPPEHPAARMFWALLTSLTVSAAVVAAVTFAFAIWIAPRWLREEIAAGSSARPKRKGNPKSAPAVAGIVPTTELRVRELQQRALLNNLPDMAWLKDQESRFIAVNEALARACGRSPDELVGRTDLDIWPRDLAECYRKHDREVMQSRKRKRTVEPLVGATGEERWIETIKTPVFGDSDEVIGTVGIARDITERRRAEAERETLHRQLVAASRQAGMAEVAIGVMQNIGGALESMNTSASLAAKRLREVKLDGLAKASALLAKHVDHLGAFLNADEHGKELPEVFGDLVKHVQTEQSAVLDEMVGLTRQLEHLQELVATQQTYAKFSGAKEQVALSELVDDALRIAQAALEREGVTVVREYRDVPPVLIDKQKVLQILLSLTSNARQALQEAEGIEKRLTLRVGEEPGGRRLRIDVIDNGVGIAPEHLDKIFLHGFTTRPDGHGHGLPHAEEAARELGATLTVASDGVGKGATFSLSLPMR